MIQVKVLRSLGSEDPRLMPNRVFEIDDESAERYFAMSPPVLMRWPPDAAPPVEPKKRGRPRKKLGSQEQSD